MTQYVVRGEGLYNLIASAGPYRDYAEAERAATAMIGQVIAGKSVCFITIVAEKA